MGRISIKANAVIALRDGFLDKPGVTGAVSVFTHNGVYAKKKDGDIFVFSNLIHGLYRVTIDSVYYKKYSFDLLVGDEVIVMDIPLYPSRNYRFDTVSTRLCGTVSVNCALSVVFLPENRGLRLIAPYQAGEKRIRLYGDFLPAAAVFSLFIQCQKKKVIVVAEASEAANEYILDSALKFDVNPENSLLGFAFDIAPEADGSYFLAVRGRYERAMFIKKQKELKLLKEASLVEGEQWIDI